MSTQTTSSARNDTVAGPARVRIPTPEQIAARTDWRDWYLTDEDDMGESPEQAAIVRLLYDLVQCWVGELGHTDTFVGVDHFVGWVEGEDLVRISPDVFVIRHAAYSTPADAPRSWQTWRPGHDVPDFALEVVSLDWRKDYEALPEKYAQLGVAEYFVFDPWASTHPERGQRVPLQRFARVETVVAGRVEIRFERTHHGAAPVWSEVLDVWLTPTTDLGLPVVRLARDAGGTDLVASTAERLAASESREQAEAERRAVAEAREQAEAERRAAAEAREQAEAERRAAAEAREQAEAERRAAAEVREQAEAERRAAAEARVAKLEAELRRLRAERDER